MKTTITGSARRTTNGVAFVLASFVVACVASPVSAASVDRIRGIILGTTQQSIDVGLPSQADVHFDMAPEPNVVIAEPSRSSAIETGATIGVVSTSRAAGSRALGIVIVPATLRLFARERIVWDRPPHARFTYGRVLRRRSGELTIDYGSGTIDVSLDRSTAVATIRPGSRTALLSPQHCLIIAHPEPDGISDYADLIIVADGTSDVPM